MNANRRFWLLAVATACLVAVAYSNHFGNGFHFDDDHTVENNIFIRDLKNIPLFFTDASTFSALPPNQSYRPIVSTTLAIDYHLGKGLNPFMFHLSTFVLFLVQGVLMFLLFYAVARKSIEHRLNRHFALAITAFYMLNTSNAETINYVIARSDSLSTQGVLAGLVLYIYSPFCRRFQLYLLPVMVGMLAKPSAAMFAPILLVYLFLFGERKLRRSIPAFLACGACYLLIALKTPATWTPGGASRFEYVISQPFVILHYFQTFLLPTYLSADADWVPITSMAHPQFALGCAFLALLVAGAVRASRQPRTLPIAFGICWYLLALLPTSVVPLAEVMNDHRMFFPDVGLALAVGWSVVLFGLKHAGRLAASRNLRLVAGGLVFAVLAGEALATHQRNLVWRDEESLWLDVTQKSPGNARGLMNYGVSQMAKGRFPVAKKYFEDALVLAPYYANLHVNLGIIHNVMGNPVEAESAFKRGLQYGPLIPASYTFYADFLSARGRQAEAIGLLQKAVEISAANLPARHALMDAYARAKQWEALAALASQTLSMFPGDAESAGYVQSSAAGPDVEAARLLSLSFQQYAKKDFIGSILTSEKAIHLRPDDADAYNNMCAAYTELKLYEKAVAACRKAIAIRPDFNLARNNLGWAEGELEKARLEEK